MPLRTPFVIFTFLLLFLIFLLEEPVHASKNDQRIDEDSFNKAFAKLLIAKNRAKIGELFKQEAYLTYKLIMAFAVSGIDDIVQERGSSGKIDMAETLAEIYAEELKENGLLKLIQLYKSFDIDKCRMKLKADMLIQDGISLREKGNDQEAMKRYVEALEIATRLGDKATSAIAAVHIADNMARLGAYSNALSYFKTAHEFSRLLGDLDLEANAINGMGDVNFYMGQ
jgi:tetratricopeptide (TPR) repeat protein